MKKNEMKQRVMISGLIVTMTISLIATFVLSKNGYVGIYGNYIVGFNVVCSLLWILVSNFIINQRYKKDV